MSVDLHPVVDPRYLVWSSNVSQIIYIPFQSNFTTALERNWWNPHKTHVLFHQIWHYSIWIAMGYVFTVHLLKWLMSHRKAFELKTPLTCWNATLAVFSLVGTLRMGEEFYFVVSRRPFEDSVCLSVNPDDVSALWAFLFMISKVAELCDTVFVVLRKRKLIFLHWYHHAVVLVYCWHSALVLTAASRWFMMMNYAVHSVMYSYYALSSYGFRFPKGISMTVTTLQTVQMLVGVLISIYVAKVKWRDGRICNQTDDNLLFCFAIYISFAFLFVRFFVSSYFFKRTTENSKKTA